MKKIQKCAAPNKFIQFIKHKSPKKWEDLDPDVRIDLRKHILEEQNGFCAYTELALKSGNCHIDHFLKRDLFPKETFKYENLLVSCNNEEYGAKYKDKKVKDKKDYNFLINPTIENPSDYLTYSLTGEIPSIDNNEKGKHTIEYFNLNERSLIERRKSITKIISSISHSIKNFTEEEVIEICGKEFETMTKQLYKDLSN